ncbi:hypothetical protein AB4084_39290, partial [Lysobacter sp. 2RAB21]
MKAAIHLFAFAAMACAGTVRAEPAGERLYGGDVLRCASSNEETVQCPADTRGGVRLIRRT